jgi:hypothetical protein
MRSALFRFQDDPSALSHFQVIIGIDKDRLLECGLADFVVAYSSQQLVATISTHDFEAEVLHGEVGGMWRGGCRLNISVAAPFVWRCLSGSAVAPFPHSAHRTGQAEPK